MDKTRVYLTEGLSSKDKKKRRAKKNDGPGRVKVFFLIIAILIIILGLAITSFLYLDSSIDLITSLFLVLFSFTLGIFLIAFSYIIKLLENIYLKLEQITEEDL